ncbi:MAG: hypothetical protein Q8P67_27820 [archaeon]|nr:hypothetical protein [archaeon]
MNLNSALIRTSSSSRVTSILAGASLGSEGLDVCGCGALDTGAVEGMDAERTNPWAEEAAAVGAGP